MQYFLNICIAFMVYTLTLTFNAIVYAQSISASPGSSVPGQSLTVTLSGIDINFGQGSSCLCPTCVDVNASDIVFQQGSSTIYPYNINVIDPSTIEATMYVPQYANTGSYDIIVGLGTACPVSCNDCFTVNYCGTSPIINFTNTNPVCYGSSDGSTSIIVTGGTPGYTFLWSTGGTDTTEYSLSAGTYTVTVTDSKGCLASSNVTLVQPPAIQINNIVITNSSCLLCSDGKIKVAVTGGIASYSYLWNNASTDKDSLTNLLPGFYSLTVSDSNGCQNFIDSLNVSFSIGVSIEKESKINLFPNPVTNKLTIEIINSNVRNVEIIISTVEGRQVQKLTRKNERNSHIITELDLNEMPDQLYIIQIKAGDEIFIRKINKLKY